MLIDNLEQCGKIYCNYTPWRFVYERKNSQHSINLCCLRCSLLL